MTCVCVRACVRTCVCVRACVCECFFFIVFFFLQNSTSLATTNRKYIFKNVCTALIGSGKETAVTHELIKQLSSLAVNNSF